MQGIWKREWGHKRIGKWCENFGSVSRDSRWIKLINRWIKWMAENWQIWQGFEILNDEEIVLSAIQEEEYLSGEENDDTFKEWLKTIRHSDAENMLFNCIEWYKKQQEADAIQILLLRKRRNTSATKTRVVLKQRKKIDFVSM